MAQAMLPLEASKSVIPGCSFPSRCNVRMMFRQARSFTLPVGLHPSSLAKMRADGVSAERTRTCGVRPTMSAMSSHFMLGDLPQFRPLDATRLARDRHDCGRGDLRAALLKLIDLFGDFGDGRPLEETA